MSSMPKIFKSMVISAILLGLFSIAGTFLVSFIFDNTIEQIEENRRQSLLKKLHVLIPPATHDNDLFTDTIEVTDKNLLGTAKPVTVYRARKNQKPVAAIINSHAPDGYSGDIELLVAIYHDGTIAGVRVLRHRETPGLGDAIDEKRSDWINIFQKRSLENPGKKGWAVKRDGGVFDQFTGATISPRAIVKAVHKTLQYYDKHREKIFSPIATAGDQ